MIIVSVQWLRTTPQLQGKISLLRSGIPSDWVPGVSLHSYAAGMTLPHSAGPMAPLRYIKAWKTLLQLN